MARVADTKKTRMRPLIVRDSIRVTKLRVRDAHAKAEEVFQAHLTLRPSAEITAGERCGSLVFLELEVAAPF